MKRFLAVFAAAAMALTMTATALAAENQVITEQDGNPERREVKVETSIRPTYTVTIPKDIQVAFANTSTEFGTISLEKAQIDVGYAVKVELNASGALKNAADENEIIPYAIQADGTAFDSGEYTKAGQSTKLTIDISKKDWEEAAAGTYSDTVTFTISYGTSAGGMNSDNEASKTPVTP